LGIDISDTKTSEADVIEPVGQSTTLHYKAVCVGGLSVWSVFV
jgi:hypothetical protein